MGTGEAMYFLGRAMPPPPLFSSAPAPISSQGFAYVSSAAEPMDVCILTGLLIQQHLKPFKEAPGHAAWLICACFVECVKYRG